MNWTRIEGTPDYIDGTGTWIAIYKRTTRGQAEFWTFPTKLHTSRRRMGTAVAIGGLYRGSVDMLEQRTRSVLAP